MPSHNLTKILEALNSDLRNHPKYKEGMNFDSVEFKEDSKIFVPRVKNISEGICNISSVQALYKEVTEDTFRRLGL